MKLRQKLAVVLATAMVVTAVPVVTMAASDNRPVKEALIVKKDSGLTLADNAGLRIELKDFDKQTQVNPLFEDVFYLDLTNAKWNGTIDAYVPGTNQVVTSGVDIQPVGDKTIKVTVTTSAAFVVPMVVKDITGEATVAINKKGSFSTVTEGKWVFATTGEKKATYTVGDVPAFYLNGEIAPITLTESYKGSMKDGLKFRLELQDGDFEFTNKGTIDLSYGFANENVTMTATIDPDNNKDYGVIEYTITGIQNPDSLGVVKLKNVAVRSTSKDPSTGDLLVDFIDVSGLVDAKDSVKVATINKYNTYIKMKDDKAVEVKAGQTKEIEFTLGEGVNDSIVGNRELEITLDAGHFDFDGLKKSGYVNSNGVFDLVKMRADGLLDDTKTADPERLIETLRFDTKANGDIIKDVLIATTGDNAQVNKTIDKAKFKLKVCVPVDKKDTEKITIKAEGRALENAVETTAITIVNPFNITTEEMRVKVGLQNQKGGKIVLTETDKAMLGKGELTIALAKDAPAGIKFTGKATLAVEGDLKKADIADTTSTGSIKIDIKRQSKAASTITISDVTVTVDRTVPEGSYDLVISGSSVDGDGHSITIKDFFVVGTPNTEDLASNGLRRGTTSFTIGESKYTANGIESTMDAASYIQDPGYTMIPVRYVAEAFGIDGKNVVFSSGSATFFAGERTIQLTNGSDFAIVNGVNIKMATKVVIKNGRTYAPVAEVAKILGVSSSWDSASKTATFTNN